MNPITLLLAFAPTATAVADRTVAVARNTGESFASMLGNILDAPATNAAATPAESKPTLAETVQSLAAQLRSWLSAQGAGDDYKIDYHLTANGESQFSIDGDSAAEVKQLLALDSSWMDKLGELASTMQAKSAQLSRDYTAPSVTIKIDQHEANVY